MSKQDNIEKFQNYLLENQQVLGAWGNYVLSTIKEKLEYKNIFLQICSYRVKTIDSAVEKISRKNYANPYQDITDLVGVRLVTLLSKDIPIVSQEIESINEWNYSKDRDFDTESQKNPDKFGYQSNHYIVRLKKDTAYGNIVIPSGTCCEVQVRDLLQHAFAEVVHDSIYKSDWEHPHRIHRFAAKSAALMETADFLLCETMTLIDKNNTERTDLLEGLAEIYKNKIQSTNLQFNQKFNENILKVFGQYIKEDTLSEIGSFWENREVVIRQIIKRRDCYAADILWKQPVVLLIYWLASRIGDKVMDQWPYGSSKQELRRVYSDLGFTYDSRS